MKYIPKEVGLDNIMLAEGVDIIYSSWTITCDGEVVHYTPRDEVNKVSKLFTDVFEVGKVYYVTLSMVRTDGPTISTKPYEITVLANDATYGTLPMPSVVDTPTVTLGHDLNNVPNSNILVRGSEFSVLGNAEHDKSHWWLIDDANNIIWKSMDDHINRSSILIDSVVLSNNKIYTIYVIYVGTNNDVSGNGSLTFGVTDEASLVLIGDLNNNRYGDPIATSLISPDPAMTSFTYTLYGDNNVSIYTETNNTGVVSIPGYIDGKAVLNSSMGWYVMELSADVGGASLGPSRVVFTPTPIDVDSDLWDDISFQYNNDLRVIRLAVPEYTTSSWLTDTSMSGTTYQFPDGSIYLKVREKQINRYSFNEVNMTLQLEESGVVFPQITSRNGTANAFNIKIFPNLKVLVTNDDGFNGTKIYQYRYNSITKGFIYETEYNIGGSDIMPNRVSEWHYLGDGAVLYMTTTSNETGVPLTNSINNPTLYVINTELRVNTLLTSGIYPSRMNCNLIRLNHKEFLVTKGTNVNTLNDGFDNLLKPITISLDNTTVTIGDEEIDRFSLVSTQGYMMNAFKQATLRNNKVLLVENSNWRQEPTNTLTATIVDKDKRIGSTISVGINKDIISTISTAPSLIRGNMMIALNNGNRIMLDNLASPMIHYS